MESTTTIEPRYFYHSATIPRRLPITLLKNGKAVTASSNIKNCKFEMHVLYYEVKKAAAAPISDVLQKQVELKRRRFMIGKTTVIDVTDSGTATTVNPLTLKSMRTRVRNLLIGHSSFDPVSAQRLGFLSKKFWTVNLLWGLGNNLMENLERTSNYVGA